MDNAPDITHFPSSKMEIPWLDYSGIVSDISQKKSYSTAEFADGWKVALVPGEDDDECGVIMNPPIGTSEYGRCCAPLGHEHPHVWGMRGWVLQNINRRKILDKSQVLI